MIAWFFALPRPVRGAIIGVAAFAAFLIAFTVWRSMDRRDAVSDAAAKVEAKAAPARETAATERLNDTLTIQDRQKERDHAAEAIPDSRPDDRELRRRCRQLRDSGRTPAACAGLEGPV